MPLYEEAPFYVFTRPDPATELVTITHLEFARATHRVARALRPNPESPCSDGKVVAIIVLADTVLFHALVTGLITANLIVCLHTLALRLTEQLEFK